MVPASNDQRKLKSWRARLGPNIAIHLRVEAPICFRRQTGRTTRAPCLVWVQSREGTSAGWNRGSRRRRISSPGAPLSRKRKPDSACYLL